MHPLETWFWGFLGSAAVELMSLVGFYASRRERLPRRYRKAGFWVTRFVLALIAGALAVAYEIDRPILAFNIGAATPLIITFMAKGLRPAPPETESRPAVSHRAERASASDAPVARDPAESRPSRS